MPFVEREGRLTWVADQARPAREQRQLIEQAAQRVADLEPEGDYVRVPASLPGQEPVAVGFRREGSDWVFDTLTEAEAD